jgi:hypothetical protein
MISNELMRLKKHDLASLVLKYQEERDILADKVESLKEEMNEIETHDAEFWKLHEVKNIIGQFKTARERYFLGVESEKETMESLMEKLMEVE